MRTCLLVDMMPAMKQSIKVHVHESRKFFISSAIGQWTTFRKLTNILTCLLMLQMEPLNAQRSKRKAEVIIMIITSGDATNLCGCAAVDRLLDVKFHGFQLVHNF